MVGANERKTPRKRGVFDCLVLHAVEECHVDRTDFGSVPFGSDGRRRIAPITGKQVALVTRSGFSHVHVVMGISRAPVLTGIGLPESFPVHVLPGSESPARVGSAGGGVPSANELPTEIERSVASRSRGNSGARRFGPTRGARGSVEGDDGTRRNRCRRDAVVQVLIVREELVERCGRYSGTRESFERSGRGPRASDRGIYYSAHEYGGEKRNSHDDSGTDVLLQGAHFFKVTDVRIIFEMRNFANT